MNKCEMDNYHGDEFESDCNAIYCSCCYCCDDSDEDYDRWIDLKFTQNKDVEYAK